MKGLLLKDFYMMKKYCKSHAVITLSFLIVSVLEKGNAFFMLYPVLLSCMIPITLISYDERQKWNVYGQTFPYSRRQMVSVKYIMTLVIVAAVCVLSAAVQLSQWAFHGYVQQDFLNTILVMLVSGLVAPAVMMPIVFKYGTEKGRIIYYTVIIIFCAAYGVIAISGPKVVIGGLSAGWIPYVMVAAGAVLFAVSWELSMVFYEKREI